MIPASGLRVCDAYGDYDASRIYGLGSITAEEPAECISAKVLQGLKKPTECPAFGLRCTPLNPLGAPMVSSEGACAAYYNYRRQFSVLSSQFSVKADVSGDTEIADQPPKGAVEVID
jgi:hydrogenase expression/formation protein HypD